MSTQKGIGGPEAPTLPSWQLLQVVAAQGASLRGRVSQGKAGPQGTRQWSEGSTRPASPGGPLLTVSTQPACPPCV